MLVNTSFTNRIYQHHNGMSLIDMLVERFTYRSREAWLELICQELILLNNTVVPPETIVTTNDALTYIVKNYDEPDVPTDYVIEFENSDVVVVTKPPQVPVQQTGRIFYNTMTNMLRRDLHNDSIVPFHRIDRETSGLMMFAKNSAFCKAHQKNMKDIIYRKFYLAIVSGPTDFQGSYVSVALGENKDSPIRTKMYVDCGKKQQSNSTFYTLASSDLHSLVLIEIHTGRKHQIRAQLEHLHHSIIGDKIYSYNGNYYLTYLERDLTDVEIKEIGSSRLLLHAFSMVINLPDDSTHTLFSTKTCSEFMHYADHFPDWATRAQRKVESILSA